MSLDAAILVLLASAALWGSAWAYVRKREKEWRERQEELAHRIEALSTHVQRALLERDMHADRAVRQLQSDVKLMQTQFRSTGPKESQEPVELAIELARLGEAPEMVASKTGLPSDIIDFITSMHQRRARH
jgi:uncharacterized membrane protein YccC